MDRQRNWLGWAALALAGLALLVAFGGRFGGPRMAFYPAMVPAAPQAPQAPQAPRFERGPGAEGVPFRDEIERELRGRGDHGFGQGFHGRGHEGFVMGRGDRHGFGPLGMIFGLFNALTKLVALGLLVWLLLRLFQQRRAPAGPAPTTPAGHDPRVE